MNRQSFQLTNRLISTGQNVASILCLLLITLPDLKTQRENVSSHPVSHTLDSYHAAALLKCAQKHVCVSRPPKKV